MTIKYFGRTVRFSELPGKSHDYLFHLRNRLSGSACGSSRCWQLGFGRPAEWIIQVVPKDSKLRKFLPWNSKLLPIYEVSLKYLNLSNQAIAVFYDFVALDEKGKILKKASSSHVFSDKTPEHVIFKLKQSCNLPGDRLELKGTFKVYGYDIDIEIVKSEKKTDSEVEIFKRKIATMLEKDRTADILIAFGKEYLLAHRCVLEYRIPEFLKIHARELDKASVERIDSDYSTFVTFMNYVYTAEINFFTFERQAKGLYDLACTYNLHELKQICLDRRFPE